jgi:hypothetical protein
MNLSFQGRKSLHDPKEAFNEENLVMIQQMLTSKKI